MIVHMPPPLVERAQRLAEADGVTISAFGVTCFERFVEQREAGMRQAQLVALREGSAAALEGVGDRP